MPNLKFYLLVSRKFKFQTVNEIETFQCQALLKNASFVKSGIEKCQLATVVTVESLSSCFLLADPSGVTLMPFFLALPDKNYNLWCGINAHSNPEVQLIDQSHQGKK